MAAVTITKPTSNSIKITNDVAEIVSYLVQRLDETTLVYTTIDGGSGSLAAITNFVDFTLADGIYKITIDPTTGANEIYIKTMFGSLESCYVTLLSKVANDGITTSCCESCSNENKTNLANFILLLEVYFSLLVAYENFESPFTSLSETTLADLVQLSKIYKNLYKYCDTNTCNCGCN